MSRVTGRVSSLVPITALSPTRSMSPRPVGRTSVTTLVNGRTERSCSAPLGLGSLLTYVFFLDSCGPVVHPSVQIAFYGLGLNSSIILTAIGFGSPHSTGSQKIYDNLNNISVGNLILAVAGLIPGYWVSFLFIDSWGRKPIQLLGFCVLTCTFVVMGFAYDKLTATTGGTKAFVFLYCLTNFFQNFGPNTTTFVIPGEIFPTRYRSTAHGISAASGKLGAIVAQVGFARLRDIGGTNAFVKHM